MQRAAIILAAGESRRLGRPKQLLSYGGLTLLQRVVRAARSSGADYVLVVTGAFADEVTEQIAAEECQIVHNEDWSEGIGSTIRCGSSFVKSHVERPEFVQLLLCDQPFVSASHLQQLWATASEDPPAIAATRYPDGAVGIPACFPAAHLESLASLSGEVGAKQLILSSPSRFIEDASAAIDIDTDTDVKTHLVVPE